LVEVAKDKDEKPKKATDVIKFMLKQRAGSTATAPTYKLKVTRFCEGTVAEWIDFWKAISELWRQNCITNTHNRVANICTPLHRGLLTSFKEKFKNSRLQSKKPEKLLLSIQQMKPLQQV
jgi:hypothetical protein